MSCRLLLLGWMGICTFLTPGCSKSGGGNLPPGNDTTGTGNKPKTPIAAMFDSIPVLVWVEAAANFSRMGTADKMDAIFQKLSDMGAKAVVMDIKGITGLVNYNSSIATRLKTWNGYTQAADFDYLGTAVSLGHKHGLKVLASMSVFAEGMNYYGSRQGKVYSDPSFAAIQSQVVTATGDVRNITDVYTYAMLNPLQPAAQSYELSLMKELVSGYDIDGFVLDYCRYFNITADFSDYSLGKFRQWANLASVSAQDIVASWTVSNGDVTPQTTGPYFKQWLEFRSQTIRDFVAVARDALKTIKPNLPVCAYTGSWYDSYYGVGVNWASKTFDPSANGYSWATPTYKNTGYAELLDMFMTGNYTPTLTGPGWWTVQGEISGTKTVLNNANIYYGGVDIGNTRWANLQNMNDAITMILKQTKGVMLFDLVHIDDPAFNAFNIQLYDDIKAVVAAAR